MQQPKTSPKKESRYNEILFAVMFIGFSGIFFILSAMLHFSGKSGFANGINYEGSPLVGMIISGILTLLGCFLLFIALRRKARTQDDASYPQGFTTQNTQELSPNQAAKEAFTFFLLFATAWLSITYFVSNAPANAGQGTWFFGLFYLIGFGVLSAAIWNGMALLNPKMTFIVYSGHLKTGDTVSVNWTIQGRASAIQDMTIEFIGYESATYVHGTDTMTDTKVFHSKTYRIPEREIRNRRGMFEITVPKNTMHSWESDNNAIIWALTVEGEMQMWRDMEESYNLTVYPDN